MTKVERSRGSNMKRGGLNDGIDTRPAMTMADVAFAGVR
jgi:hypothetical protein